MPERILKKEIACNIEVRLAEGPGQNCAASPGYLKIYNFQKENKNNSCVRELTTIRDLHANKQTKKEIFKRKGKGCKQNIKSYLLLTAKASHRAVITQFSLSDRHL